MRLSIAYPTCVYLEEHAQFFSSAEQVPLESLTNLPNGSFQTINFVSKSKDIQRQRHMILRLPIKCSSQWNIHAIIMKGDPHTSTRLTQLLTMWETRD